MQKYEGVYICGLNLPFKSPDSKQLVAFLMIKRFAIFPSTFMNVF